MHWFQTHIAALFLVPLFAITGFLGIRSAIPLPPDVGTSTGPVACTMDARQCPDGSWVGRSGPHCQLVCPPLPATTTPATPSPKPTPQPEEPVICTMDAMRCPDGSWVGRSGPRCEFICPGTAPLETSAHTVE